MKSPPPETGPPSPKEEKQEESEAGKEPSVTSQVPSESEKDSGYSDSSSESISSEETNGSALVRAPGCGPPVTSTVQTAYTPIYILQNVVLKQPRIVLLQTPVRRHRRRPTPSSYLPILRSYPRIAPRVDPAPTPRSTPSPAPRASTPPINRPSASHLLEVSLRSLDLLRRTRETQQSIRELRAHTRLYEQAVKGEEGGWERLQRAMEQSGGYRSIQSSSALETTAEQSPIPTTSLDAATTLSGDTEIHKEEMMTSENISSPCEEELV